MNIIDNLEMIPFHVHSVGSLLDGIIKIDDYVKWALENNMKAIGVSDHKEMTSLISLYKECNKNNIKPLLAVEFYLTQNEDEKIRDNEHIVVIAKSNLGYKNLIKLHNYSWTNFHHRPRITFSKLKEFNQDLIATSACLAGSFGKLFLNNEFDKIDDSVNKYLDIFGENFYFELQEHGIEKQKEYNLFLIELSVKYNIPLIIQNDAHYLSEDDAFAHEILLCKNTGSKISNEKRFKFDSKEFYLKNKDQLRLMFDYISDDIFNECLINTNKIADSCSVDLKQDKYNYPKLYKTEQESVKKLNEFVIKGFNERFKNKNIDKKVYLERIKYEISVVRQLETVDYFLLLEDVCRFCRENDIYTNFSRGSGCASLVLYCLYVTHLDPIIYNLPFQRFLNLDRKNAADFDLDVDKNDRERVLEYIRNRFGEDKVCNIATYGTLTAKSAFKAVASILEMPFSDANNISKQINEKISLRENLENNNFLKECYTADSLFRKIFDNAQKLEGVKDKRGLHAAALIISNDILDDTCPTILVKNKETKTDIKASSYTMSEVDGDLKLLKLDILGLRNLSIVKDTIKLIEKRTGIYIDFKSLDFKDQKAYEMLHNGNSSCIFQLESNGMSSLLKRIKPTEHRHLDAIVALFRPGSLQFINQYIENKNNPDKITYIDDRLKPIFEDTYGIYCYQEQVMSIAQALAGFTMAEADMLRYAIGKKKIDELKKYQNKFIEGCVDGGLKRSLAEELFNQIMEFSNYSFNRSHSAAYSALSYVTAYLKCYYPIEFMCSVLNSVANNPKKLSAYLAETMRLGINILTPDINISTNKFEIDSNNNIRFGFSFIKGVGDKSINPIIEERNKNGDFKSFLDFIKRCNVDKTTATNLLKLNAFASLENNSKYYLNILESLLEAKKKLIPSINKKENKLWTKEDSEV